MYLPFFLPSVLVRCSAGKRGEVLGVQRKMASALRMCSFNSRWYSPYSDETMLNANFEFALRRVSHSGEV